MGRIIDGPTAAQLRATLERALDPRPGEHQGTLLLDHQRAVTTAIATTTRSRRDDEDRYSDAPSGTVISEVTPVERAWARARAESGL